MLKRGSVILSIWCVINFILAFLILSYVIVLKRNSPILQVASFSETEIASLSQIKRGDGVLVWFNLFCLLFVGLLPATAAILGRFPSAFLAITCFALDVALIQLTTLWLWQHASRQVLINPLFDPRVVLSVGRRLNLSIQSLQIEHLRETLGIGTDCPRLSWQIECFSAEGRLRGQSVHIESSQLVLVDWNFVPLQSRERVSLRGRVWGTDGSESAWSEPVAVEAGLLHADD